MGCTMVYPKSSKPGSERQGPGGARVGFWFNEDSSAPWAAANGVAGGHLQTGHWRTWRLVLLHWIYTLFLGWCSWSTVSNVFQKRTASCFVSFHFEHISYDTTVTVLLHGVDDERPFKVAWYVCVWFKQWIPNAPATLFSSIDHFWPTHFCTGQHFGATPIYYIDQEHQKRRYWLSSYLQPVVLSSAPVDRGRLIWTPRRIWVAAWFVGPGMQRSAWSAGHYDLFWDRIKAFNQTIDMVYTNNYIYIHITHT